MTQRLIKWYASDGDKTAANNTCGINTTVVQTLQENLPSKSDKFVWGEPATDKQFPSTLDVQFTNGSGFLLIIR